MRWTEREIPDLDDRVVIVTGANSGIGLEAADMLKARGAHVVLACRNPAKADAARERLELHARGSVTTAPLDLASLHSVREFASYFLGNFDRLDVLINNAGVMAIPFHKTRDGFEMQFGTNHLGHFALTALLADRLLATERGRIVNVTSLVHRAGRVDFDNLQGERSYSRWGAYFQSKLANLMFTKELARRLARADRELVVAACHPGYSSTNLQAGGARMTGEKFKENFMNFANGLVAQSARMGALPTVYAAVSDDVRSGDLIGPSGPFAMAGHPKKERPARHADDADVAARLFEVSERLTEVRFES